MLDVVIAGQISPNPSELIDSDRMRELIREAAQNYDLVVGGNDAGEPPVECYGEYQAPDGDQALRQAPQHPHVCPLLRDEPGAGSAVGRGHRQGQYQRQRRLAHEAALATVRYAGPPKRIDVGTLNRECSRRCVVWVESAQRSDAPRPGSTIARLAMLGRP